jgi:ADP-ribose pyrophosphatase YjhB (NUDIX family)
MTIRDYPRVGVGIIVLKQDAVLLIKRSKPPAAGAWSLPGGRQEWGETAQEAARRELHEETGLAVGALTLAGYVDSIHRDDAGAVLFHYTILDFAALYEGGDARAGSDAAALAWVKFDEFDQYDLWSEARRLIGCARSLIL